MAENLKDKRDRASADARSQQEANAEAVREKTARLRALRLARDAETGNQTSKGATAAGKPPAAKKRHRNSGKKGASLAEWLAAQQKDGRHN